MTYPASAQDAPPFTPAHYEGAKDAPVYFLRTPTARLETRVNAEARRRGLRYWSPVEAERLAEREIARLFEGKGDPAAVIALLRESADLEAEEMAFFNARPETPPAPDSDEAKALAETLQGLIARRAELDEKLEPFFDMLRRGSEAFCKADADNFEYLDEIPRLRVAVHVERWENLDVPYAERKGMLTPECVDALDPADVTAISNELYRRARLSKAQRKNSAPPSGSTAGPEVSAADASRQTADPAGSSAPTESSGRKTRA